MAKIDKLLKQAKEHLDEGEQPLQTVLGAYETKIMGGDSVRNGIFIATDQRLLFYAKKLTGYDFSCPSPLRRCSRREATRTSWATTSVSLRPATVAR